MSGPRIGSLFSGYGGLEMGVQAVLGGTTAWVSDICRIPTKDNPATHYEPHRSPCKILAHRYPDVPNLGDISAVDWSTVEPVDVLTGGFPCQDVSHAGKRKGMKPDTRSGLWSQMCYAIDQLRPALVVAENVRGLLSAEAHSDVELCPWCMGDGSAGAPLRALGAVLGDLADIGYDAVWYGLRAADVGAPHGRFRVFVVAYPQGHAGRISYGDGGSAADAGRLRGGAWWTAGPREAEGGRPLDHVAGRGLLPTPRATDGTKGGPNQRGSSGDLMLPSAVSLLPTPAVNDMGAAYTPDEWDAWTDRMKAEHGNGNGHGKSLSIEAARLLPTPRVGADRTGRSAAVRRDSMSAPSLSQAIEISKGELPREFNSWDELPPSWQPADDLDTEAAWMVREEAAFGTRWGDYADAIHRWEQVLGRTAPDPTQASTKGNPQLAPAFVEWMMGLPLGHVTDVPGITRTEALKACGNGVVPQQAEAALRVLLSAASIGVAS